MSARTNSNAGEISAVRVAECKAAAHERLKDLCVAAPNEIDLPTIAWRVGRLRIKDGGLDHAEGRIVVASKNSGFIRVKQGLTPARRRFVIAHEIGHFALHPREGLSQDDTARNFTVWKDACEETEANLFAGELLMPEFLMKPRARGKTPSLSLVNDIAHEFATSLMATAYQYVTYTNEQTALVVSEGNRIKWYHRSKDFWPWIRKGEVHAHSAAGERLSGKAGDVGRMVRSPAYAWLSDFENDREHDVMEDSRYLDWYGVTITLLWLKEDLED